MIYEWKECFYSDIFDHYKGKSLSKNNLNENGDYECLLYGQLFTIYKEVIDCIASKTDINDGFDSKFNDLLMPGSTTTNGFDLAIASAIIKDNVKLGGDVNIFRPKMNIDSRFIAYLTPLLKNEIVKYTQGTTVIHLQPKQLMKNLLIKIPESIKEQSLIVENLLNIDKLIMNKSSLIEKKKLIKQGAIQELLTGKKRLPGFNEIWKNLLFGDLFELLKGRGLSKEKLVNNGTNKCILYGELFTTYGPVIKDVVSSTNYEEGVLSKKDDLLMPGSTTTNGYDLATASVISTEGVLLGGDINIFRPKKEINTNFISLLLPLLKNQIIQYTQGTTIIHLQPKEMLKGLYLFLPDDLNEQNEIVRIVLDMEQEINSLELDLEKYKQIKQGMMEQLLTGKIRLVEKIDNEQTLPEKKHNQHFDDAVVFANIVASCYDPGYPLGRKKCQKMMYLFKRFNECSVDQFKHYAAGPYDNKARYGGFETIAIKNKYVVENKSAKGSSFAPGPEIEKAKAYCSKYGYDEFIPIFNQYLKYKKVDELELYTTVDKTILELKDQGSSVNLNTVKTYISNDKTWVPKLSREVFNDENIEEAIRFSQLVLGA